VNFTLTFSEVVTGVDTAYFTLTTSGISGAAVSGFSGSGNIYTVTVNTGSGNGAVSNFVAVDGDTYTFNLTPSAQGLVTANIAAGIATDLAGNGNTAATQFNRTYIVVYKLFLPLILR
jgi:hypothetical protein